MTAILIRFGKSRLVTALFTFLFVLLIAFRNQSAAKDPLETKLELNYITSILGKLSWIDGGTNPEYKEIVKWPGIRVALGDQALGNLRGGEYGIELEKKYILHSSEIPNKINFLHGYPWLIQPTFLCTFNAAIMHNPESRILVHAQNVDDMNSRWALSHLAYVKSIYLEKMSQFTGIDSWWRQVRLLNPPVSKGVKNAAQKLALMYRNGGIFLELDMVTLRPLKQFQAGRFLVRSKDKITDKVFGVQKEDAFIKKVIDEFLVLVKPKNESVAVANNPDPSSLVDLFDTTFTKFCVDREESFCSTLNIIPASLFPQIADLGDETFAVKWDRNAVMEWDKEFLVADDSLLGKVMADHCPLYRGHLLPKEQDSWSSNSID